MVGGFKYTNFYEIESGLIVGNKFQIETADEVATTTEKFSDYRTVDGVKYPFHRISTTTSTINNTTREVKSTTTVASITHNLRLPDKMLRLPPKIWKAPGLPSAAAIFNRHIEAIGGQDRLSRLRSYHAVYELLKPSDKTKRVRIIGDFMDGPMLRVRFEMDGKQISEEGIYKGSVWAIPNGEAKLLTGIEREWEIFWAPPNPYVDFNTRFQAIKTKRRKTYYGEECFDVRAKTHFGVTIRFFFSIESGLCKGMATQRDDGNDGKRQIEQNFADYGMADGVLMPHSVTTKTRYIPANRFTKSVLELVKIKHNVDFPEDHFVPPQAVTRLIADRKKTSTPSVKD